jgi:hypothetical protein
VLRAGRPHTDDDTREVLIAVARRYSVGRAHAEWTILAEALDADRGHDP